MVKKTKPEENTEQLSDEHSDSTQSSDSQTSSAEVKASDGIADPQANAAESALDVERRTLDEEIAASNTEIEALDLPNSKAGEKQPKRERRVLTPQQRKTQNLERKNRGLALLKQSSVGVAHVSRKITFVHRQLYDLFLRTYPVINRALAGFNRSGGLLLGSESAQTVEDNVMSLVKQSSEHAHASFGQARVLIDNSKASAGINADDLDLKFSPSFDDQIEALSPQALKLLSAFSEMDLALIEHDRLVWSSLVLQRDADREFAAFKQKITQIVSIMVRTQRAQRRKLTEMYAEPPEPIQAAAV